MHLTTRADAFNNLLADITALGEAQGLRLLGLLGQIAIAYILPVSRHSMQDAPHLYGFRSYRLCPSTYQYLPDGFRVGRLKPNLIPARSLLRPTDKRDVDAC